jgi:hypothetical protein
MGATADYLKLESKNESYARARDVNGCRAFAL